MAVKLNLNTQFWLAFIIVGISFVLIGYMLYIQASTTSDIRDQIKSMIASGNLHSNQTSILIASLEETEKSNQSTFNILLPVFAAWVTAVVAFYFHSQIQDKSQETIRNLSSQIGGNSSSDTQIEKLLRDHPGAKKIVTVLSTDTLETVDTKSKEFYNVVVVDKKGKPLGILYRSDLPDITPSNTAKDLMGYLKTTVTDPITCKPWTDDGVKNFAKIRLQDTVSQAKQEMDKIKKGDPKIRGIVFDNDEMVAIIDYQLLTEVLSNS